MPVPTVGPDGSFAAAGFEQEQGIANCLDVVDAEDLYLLPGQGQRRADGARQRVGLGRLGRQCNCRPNMWFNCRPISRQKLADKTFARMAYQQGAVQGVKAPGIGHQGEIVFQGLAETDARVQGDAVLLHSGAR